MCISLMQFINLSKFGRPLHGIYLTVAIKFSSTPRYSRKHDGYTAMEVVTYMYYWGKPHSNMENGTVVHA